MILDFSARPDEARLYDVLDAATGEPIDEPIFYADDKRGFYRRHSRLDAATLSDFVRRPIRIVPRLERLCASLRASLAEQGVSADDLPEPVLGALALFQERLEAIERRVSEAIAHPQVRVEAVTTPPVNSAEWLEAVTRSGRPWTRANLERFLPQVRVESVTTPEAIPVFDPATLDDIP